MHFLTSGIASIVTNMENGQVSEGGLVGREGMPESLHLLGPGLVRTSCFMRIAGTLAHEVQGVSGAYASTSRTSR